MITLENNDLCGAYWGTGGREFKSRRSDQMLTVGSRARPGFTMLNPNVALRPGWL